jgi:hypothetical protein
MSSVSGNIIILNDAGFSPCYWLAPSALDWFFIYGAAGPMMTCAFDQEAPIIFPQRTMWRNKFSSVTFAKFSSGGAVCVARFTYGRGKPPEYPTLDDCGVGLMSETAAHSLIAANSQYALSGTPILAVWISVPPEAAVGVWVNEIGTGPVARGIFIAPGKTKRIRAMSPAITGGTGQLYVSNVDFVNAVQLGIAYEAL